MSSKTKLLIVMGLLFTVGLACGICLVLVRQKRDHDRAAETATRLRELFAFTREFILLKALGRYGQAPPRSDGSGGDPTGQGALHERYTDPFEVDDTLGGLCDERGFVVDGWSRPFVYRCPGPIHRHGWDLYSVGPNGIDESGGGDDILVGEDVAGVGTGS
ncbi:MAG TPA: type II secretion system protein GspG [Planctomycetota bacterium]|nr:type II secretion system protein GspG [Planctomycetota bacterium]